MKGRSPNRPRGVGVGWGRGGSEETSAGDSARSSVGCSECVAIENKFLKQFISSWRRNNQQYEVAEEGGHVLRPQPSGLCQGQWAEQTVPGAPAPRMEAPVGPV